MFVIGIMVTLGFARTHGQEGAHLANEETRPFIKTAQRSQRIIRPGQLIEHIFHLPQVTTCHLTDAPLFPSPGFPLVFFTMLLTLSCEIVSTLSRLISFSAMSCRVQRAAPCGGAEHASMVTWASILLSHF